MHSLHLWNTFVLLDIWVDGGLRALPYQPIQRPYREIFSGVALSVIVLLLERTTLLCDIYMYTALWCRLLVDKQIVVKQGGLAYN